MTTKFHKIICECVNEDTGHVGRWVQDVTASYDWACYIIERDYLEAADAVWIEGPDVPCDTIEYFNIDVDCPF